MTKPCSLAALAALFLSVLFGAGDARASDWIGAYGAIDKIRGVFALADPKLANRPLDFESEGYQAPQPEHLYFSLPAVKSSAALRDWAAWAAIAGKREVVGFGVRYTANEFPVRLPKPDEAAKDPGIYVSAEGVIRQEYHGSHYPPVKPVLEVLRQAAP